MRKHGTSPGLADPAVVVQQIEVQYSRPVDFGANPAESGFDIVEDLQQPSGRQGRDHLGDTVDEPRLIGRRDGRAFIPARPAYNTYAFFLESPKRSLATAHRKPMFGVWEVGSNPYIDHNNPAEFTRMCPSRDEPC
jgi:hypothetical protein